MSVLFVWPRLRWLLFCQTPNSLSAYRAMASLAVVIFYANKAGILFAAMAQADALSSSPALHHLGRRSNFVPAVQHNANIKIYF
jgi:hypothetical protein